MTNRKIGELAFYIDSQRFHIIPVLKIDESEGNVLIEPVKRISGGWRSAGFRVRVPSDNIYETLADLEREIRANIDRTLHVWRKEKKL